MSIGIKADDDVSIMHRARKKLAAAQGIPENKISWLSLVRVAIYQYLREEVVSDEVRSDPAS